jgi:hypothetical protein
MDTMTSDELNGVFAMIRQHSSPMVWPLLDSVHRMAELDREFIASTEAKLQLVDALLEQRVAALGRHDD